MFPRVIMDTAFVHMTEHCLVCVKGSRHPPAQTDNAINSSTAPCELLAFCFARAMVFCQTVLQKKDQYLKKYLHKIHLLN